MKFSKEWIIPLLLGVGLIVSILSKLSVPKVGAGGPREASLSNQEIPLEKIDYIQFSPRKKVEGAVDEESVIFCQISFLDAKGKVIKSSELSGIIRALPTVIRDMAIKFGVGGEGFAIVDYGTYFKNTKEDPDLPSGEEVRINLEVKDVIPKSQLITANGKKVGIVLIDMDKNGLAETLKGGDWKKMPKNNHWIDLRYTRDLKLGGKVEKREWVGPDTGVFMIGRKIGEVAVEDLVGTYTGGMDWDSGYDVLRQFDENSSERLAGDEMSELYIWVDKNSDAMSQEDEIFAAKDILDSIVLRPSELTGTKERSSDGVKFLDKTDGGTWEWKSRSGS